MPAPARPSTRQLRVLVVDDHPAVRTALAAVISDDAGLELVGLASSADEALALMAEPVDVAVVDISLQEESGLELIERLHALDARLRIVVFSMHDEMVFAEQVLRAGASSYLMKREPTAHVVEAIYRVARGEVYVSRKVASRLLRRQRPRAAEAPSVADFTAREQTVLPLLAEGYDDDEIGRVLTLAPETVAGYRQRILSKAGVADVDALRPLAARIAAGQDPPTRL